MPKDWKQAHDFLYDESGDPTEEFYRLQEQLQAPDDDSDFPMIRVSRKAHRLLNNVKRFSVLFGEADSDSKEGREKILHAYSNLQKYLRQIYQYIEGLEHEAGIPRQIKIRF